MSIISTMSALAALLLCTACSNQPKTAANVTDTSSQQYSSIRWEDTISASQSARVTNGGLIFMR